MAEYDRVVEDEVNEVPEIPEVLQHVLLAALNEAKGKLEAGEDVVPFTALAIKDSLFIETHPGNETEECLAYARHTVQNATGADCYALCYDGYIDTDAGMVDAIIAEGGVPGGLEGYAIGYLYEVAEDGDSEGLPRITSDPFYVGPAPNFMMLTRLHEENEVADADDETDEELAYPEDEGAPLPESPEDI